jgi:uncharacterized iron-regulated protein
MKRILSCTAFLTVLLLLPSCTFGDGASYQRVLRMRDGKIIPFSAMIDDLKGSDIVFVGEIHDSMRDHATELAIIRALHDQGISFGIGLEMFKADSQKSLDGWSNKTLDRAKFVRIYYNNWHMPWPYYGDIFTYARLHAIPLAGLNVPDAISRKVATKGFGSLTSLELAQLPPGISCRVDREYMDYIKRVYESHSTQQDSFVHFCEAQMVWDKSMAWHLLRYMKRHRGQKMVVISGTGHAWKRGIPEQVRQDSSYKFKVVLPALPTETMRSSITSADADYLFVD